MWIKENTRTCPFCKKQVQKSFGCDFMFCSPPGGCGKSFCYVCEQPWSDESVSHGVCKARRKEAATKIDIIQKVNFYRDRFYRYEKQKAHFRDNNLRQFRQHVRDLQVYQDISERESRFLADAMHLLLQSRDTLKWSHVFAFSLDVQKDFSFKEVLHLNMDRFEDICDDLVQYLQSKIGALMVSVLREMGSITKDPQTFISFLQAKSEIARRTESIRKQQAAIFDLVENF